MSVSILEALENASINLRENINLGPFIVELACGQLHNAVVLLEKGYELSEEVEPLLEKYGEVENVPNNLENK